MSLLYSQQLVDKTFLSLKFRKNLRMCLSLCSVSRIKDEDQTKVEGATGWQRAGERRSIRNVRGEKSDFRSWGMCKLNSILDIRRDSRNSPCCLHIKTIFLSVFLFVSLSLSLCNFPPNAQEWRRENERGEGEYRRNEYLASPPVVRFLAKIFRGSRTTSRLKLLAVSRLFTCVARSPKIILATSRNAREAH